MMACLAGPSFHEANGSAACAMVAVKASTPTSAAASRFGLPRRSAAEGGFVYDFHGFIRFLVLVFVDWLIVLNADKPLSSITLSSGAFQSLGLVLISVQFALPAVNLL